MDPIQQLTESIDQAKALYHQLVLLVGPSGSGKTAILQQVAEIIHSPRINVNLELSRRLLDVPRAQRPFEVFSKLQTIIRENSSDVVLLDNLELLFSKELEQDPLMLLKKLARNQTIVTAWSGTIERGNLIYAEPSHHEYRRYPIKDFLLVNLTE